VSGYAEIDAILIPWAEARGLHVYTGHRQNVVRSLTVYVWMGARHESTGHIWIDPLNEMGLVGIHAAARGLRFDEAVTLDALESALDAACEKLAQQQQRAEASSA